jgi:LIVCS family branched-chain amino acid:cation transporter
MEKSSKNLVIIGFALFAMFFGAGNLIFPPFLGRLVGTNFLTAMIGFLITGVGLPLCGVIACAKINGTFSDMASKVGEKFSIISTTALILAIGPMLAIPRTAATTFELSIRPIFPFISPTVSSVIYFCVALVFVLKPSSIVDNIGKILTPGLLIMLSVIIIKGIISPIGTIGQTAAQGVFTKSMLEGYQTMDAMASVIFASIVITTVKAKGYKEPKEITMATIKSAMVAVVGLAFVYGGLMYLGSQTTSLVPEDVSRTELLTTIVKMDLGSIGSIVLGLCVALACLTTAIGLLSTGSDFFNKNIFKEKVSYNTIAITMAVISAILAVKGVDQIVKLSVPILNILYPIVIVLIIMTLMGKLVKSHRVVKVTTYVTAIISVLDTINGLGNFNAIKGILKMIPLSDKGFAWLVPTVIAFLIASLLFKREDNEIISKRV